MSVLTTPRGFLRKYVEQYDIQMSEKQINCPLVTDDVDCEDMMRLDEIFIRKMQPL